MKDFIVLYHIVTPVSLSSVTQQQKGSERWKFSLAGGKDEIIVQEYIVPYHGIQRSVGLDFYLKLTAPDNTSAESVASDMSAIIYALMCFQGRTYAERVEHLSTLEVIDGLDDNLTYVIHDEPFVLKTNRRAWLRKETFDVLWVRDSELAKADKARRKQLHVAMAMLRNGIAQGPKISKFLHYWVGIAALDHHLKVVEANNGALGWRAIFKRHGLDYDEFEGVRNDLAHPISYKNFTKSFRFALDHMDLLEPVLAETVGRLFELPEPVLKKIMAQEYLGPNESWTVLKGKVEGVPSTFDDVPTHYSHFQGLPVEKVVEVNGENTIGMKYKLNQKADFGPGVKASITEVQMHTRDIAGMSSVEPPVLEQT